MPGPKELLAIRNHIAAHPAAFRRILAQRQIASLGGLQGDQLVRLPKGFLADHPAADLLRYKQFLVWMTHPPEIALSKDLLHLLVETFGSMLPLVRFLNIPLKPATTDEHRQVTSVV